MLTTKVLFEFKLINIFDQVSVDEISNEMLKFKVKNITGYDNIPSKLVKYVAHILCFSFQALINKCILQGVFTGSLKKANVTSVYKNNGNSTILITK
jgi:hypothetical protein